MVLRSARPGVIAHATGVELPALGPLFFYDGLVLTAFVVTLCPDAQAVPSFTRQTGLACRVCHSNPPELTAFGRKFKLDGYTLTDKKPDTTIDDKDLKLSRYFPIGGMISLGETGTNTPQPDSQNWNANANLSLYLAGEMAPHFGGMIQTTYSTSSDHLTLNNTDIRYANHTTLGSNRLVIWAYPEQQPDRRGCLE
jgi:hypothetical protein